MKLSNKNKNKTNSNNNMKENSKNNGDNTQKRPYLEELNSNKCNRCPPPVEDLVAFEEDMIELVHQIRFRKVKSNFQRKKIKQRLENSKIVKQNAYASRQNLKHV